MTSTRDDIIAAARRQFADKGFYGASIALIAGDLGLTKQALLHHFGSKEKLYGEVLQNISASFVSQAIQASAAGDPARRFEDLMLSIYRDATRDLDATRLLMRELLDNRRRAESAQTWYLKPFLDALVALLRQNGGWRAAPEGEALAAVYQVLGAINYFAVSDATLGQMFGRSMLEGMQAAYPDRLRKLISAMIASPPATE